MLGTTLILASACETQRGTGAGVGAVGGGVIGGALGGKTGLLIGAAAGGLLGYGVGRSMEENDRRRIVYALESNEPTRWSNPETGYQYEVQPTQTYVDRGRQCRDFRMLAEVNSEPEEVYGTACRHDDGNWEVVSSDDQG